MRLKQKPDIYLLITVCLLVLLGLVILCSASVVLSQERFGHPYGYLKHQLIFGVLVGALAGYLAYKFPYQKWQKLALPLLLLTLILLSLVFIPQLNHQAGGAKRWLEFGSLVFQPSELAKLTLIIYFAAMLTKKSSQRHRLFLVFVLLAIISGFLISQPDISTLAIILITSLAIYFLAGAKLSYLLGISAAYGLAFMILIRLVNYRWQRLLVYFNPQIDIAGIGYQVNQALLALGSGGIFGLGLGHSRQKYNYLPEPMGDSIFAVYGEELGFIGALFLLGLFIFLFIRGFQIHRRAGTGFGRLLAFGISFWLFFQAFVNMAAICTLLPMTGVPLPFISYGGSSMAVSLVAVGILLNISKQTKQS